MSLKSDLEAATALAGQLEAELVAKNAQIVTLTQSNTAKDLQIQTLTTQLNDCLNQTPTEPPPPPPPPPSGGTDIPSGTEVSPSELASRLAAAPNGAVFRVKPGQVTGVSLKLKPGQQVWALDPANPPWFQGPNSYTNPLRFAEPAGASSPDVVLGYLKISGYHPANPTWVEVAGNEGSNRRNEAIDGRNFPGMRLYRLEMFGNGCAVDIGLNMLLEECHLHHNHQFATHGNGAKGWKILKGEWNHNNVRPDGRYFYHSGIGAGTKLVSCTDGVYDGLYTHDNGGPGVWHDSGGNNVKFLRVISKRNKGSGIFWELNNGWCLIEECDSSDNQSAADIHIANSTGTSAQPIIIRRNKVGKHTAGREVRMLGNGQRSPKLGHVLVEENVVDGKILLALTNSHPAPPGIIVRNNKRPDGSPVGLT